MKIKKIRLKGYKRFLDLSIDLGTSPKRIIALVGPNGCGKSSVIDGMLFFNISYNMPLGNKEQKDYKYHSLKQEVNYSYENIEIELESGNIREYCTERHQKGSQTTLFSFRSPYRYNSNLNIQESRATIELKNNEYGASCTADLDDKIEESYRKLLVKFNNYLKDNRSTVTYQEGIDKIIGDLNKSLQNCLDLKIVDLGDIDDKRGTLFFKKDDQPNEFEFNVLSAGEKEVVDILLDLYLRSKDYNDTIFVFDEPELHINTSIQRQLLIEINNLIGDNCQIWIATHSIGFLRALQDELKEDSQIIHFKRDFKWGAEPCTLTPMTKGIHSWREIFKTALDDLSGLLSPKQIIYCEGEPNTDSGKEEGLDATVFNHIFSEEYSNTLFISAGGDDVMKNSSIALQIISKAFSGVNIIRLKDRDEKNDKERQEFLDFSNANRMLNRREIENYLFDKEVLKNYAQDKEVNFNEEIYDKNVTDIITQDLKPIQQKIQSSVGVKGKIKDFKKDLRLYIPIGGSIYKELEKCIF